MHSSSGEGRYEIFLMALFLLFHFSSGSVFIFCPVLFCDNVMIYASPQVQNQRFSWEKAAVWYILCLQRAGICSFDFINKWKTVDLLVRLVSHTKHHHAHSDLSSNWSGWKTGTVHPHSPEGDEVTAVTMMLTRLTKIINTISCCSGVMVVHIHLVFKK